MSLVVYELYCSVESLLERFESTGSLVRKCVYHPVFIYVIELNGCDNLIVYSGGGGGDVQCWRFFVDEFVG